jgi:hypothetical protein
MIKALFFKRFLALVSLLKGLSKDWSNLTSSVARVAYGRKLRDMFRRNNKLAYDNTHQVLNPRDILFFVLVGRSKPKEEKYEKKRKTVKSSNYGIGSNALSAVQTPVSSTASQLRMKAPTTSQPGRRESSRADTLLSTPPLIPTTTRRNIPMDASTIFFHS